MFATKPETQYVNRRASTRFICGENCVLMLNERQIRAVTLNISTGGMAAQLQGLGRIDIGDVVDVQLSYLPTIRAQVRWMKSRKVGLQFDEPLDQHPGIIALLERLEGVAPNDREDAPDGGSEKSGDK